MLPDETTADARQLAALRRDYRRHGRFRNLMSDAYGRIPVVRHMTTRNWAWLHFKIALIGWALWYATFTPSATAAALDIVVLLVWLGATVLGGVVSSVGLVISTQPTDWAHKRGVQIELGGLSLLAIGPLVYFTTQLSFVIQQNVDDFLVRGGPAGLGYALFAAVVARLVEVIPRYRRELMDMKPSGGAQ